MCDPETDKTQREEIARLRADDEWSFKRITELEEALRAVVRDVNDYERVNNLAPNPGRSECWDSVAAAKAVLAKRK